MFYSPFSVVSGFISGDEPELVSVFVVSLKQSLKL